MINFKNYDLEGLLQLFNNDFYNVIKTKNMFFDYLKAISCRLCDIYQTESYPQIKSDLLEGNVIGRAKSRQEIVLNEKYLDAFPIYQTNKNLFYAFTTISTLIHETRHYLQANAKVNIDPLVKAFSLYKITAPKDALRHINYGTAINEIDARFFTYQTLKDNQNYEKYLLSAQNIGNEEILSKQLSSHALSIDDALKQINLILPQDQFAIMDMDKCYSHFLDEAGINKNDYKQITSLSDRLSLKMKLASSSTLSRFVKETYDDLSLASRASTDDLNQVLQKSKFRLRFLLSVSDNEKIVLDEMFRLRALLHYETDMLYKLLAPEHFDLFQKPRQENPEDIKEFYQIKDKIEKGE